MRQLGRVCRTTVIAVAITVASPGAVINFSTGSPDGAMGVASRPGGGAPLEIEAADDFILSTGALITGATFTGLLPFGLPLSDINFVGVEIYRVFPLDSTNPPSGNVPTRTNSPSDVAFDSRDTTAGNLTSVAAILNPTFSVTNTVVNGINPIPNQTTGGEGPARGEEVEFTIDFTQPFSLPAGHYFFVPQVGLNSGDFLWLSSTESALFTGDLQAWVRNGNLDPDWLRVGTDIVGSGRFDLAFSLTGTVVPEPWSVSLTALGLALAAAARRINMRF